MNSRVAIAVCLILAGTTFGQAGGGGNPRFDQPTDAKPQPARSTEGRYDLRPKFEKGQNIKLKLEVNNLAEQPAIEIDMLEDPEQKPAKPSRPSTPPGKRDVEKTKSRIEFGIVMNVQNVDAAGNATVGMTFQTVKVSVDGPGMKEEFDSTKPPKAPKPGEVDIIGTVLKPLVGTTMTLTVDRSGNISSVTGGEGFAMLGQVTPGSGGSGSLPQVIGPIFNIKKGDGFARIGEAWENTDKLSSGLMGDFKMTAKHTLESVAGNIAKVDLKGKIEAGSMAPGGTTFQVKDSSYRGSYSWDLARGMIKSMGTSMSMTIEHSLQGTPVTVTSETTTKLTRVD
jgi:hypothetical protein